LKQNGSSLAGASLEKLHAAEPESLIIQMKRFHHRKK